MHQPNAWPAFMTQMNLTANLAAPSLTCASHVMCCWGTAVLQVLIWIVSVMNVHCFTSRSLPPFSLNLPLCSPGCPFYSCHIPSFSSFLPGCPAVLPSACPLAVCVTACSSAFPIACIFSRPPAPLLPPCHRASPQSHCYRLAQRPRGSGTLGWGETRARCESALLLPHNGQLSFFPER